MPVSIDFPRLDNAAQCVALWSKYPQKAVGMWATGYPRQNVDILWRLRQELIKLGVPVIFFFNESAADMVHKVINEDSNPSGTEDVYQLDDPKLLKLLSFIEVLVTNDTFFNYEFSRCTNAKIVGMPHHAKVSTPNLGNYYYDYFISDVNQLGDFDFSLIPDSLKIHRNPYFTLLEAGHPKIDLILEERVKNISSFSPPVLLLYPNYFTIGIPLQNLSNDMYEDIWSKLVSEFLLWSPQGIVVYRPHLQDRADPIIENLRQRFNESGRFFIDLESDNKFWISRADYFVTDYSGGFVNFCMSAKRPAIRMVYTREEEEPIRDVWGWTISRPTQLPGVLDAIDREEKQWTESLLEKQKREMPGLGRNFSLLAEKIKRIFTDDDDPAWLRMDKGHTACETRADTLKIVANFTRNIPNSLWEQDEWMETVHKFGGAPIAPQIWLLCLRRALLTDCDERDSTETFLKSQLIYKSEAPYTISKYIAKCLNNSLHKLPFMYSVGLIRHLVRKYPQRLALSLLLTSTSKWVSGPDKKKALFFLLMELPAYEKEVLLKVNELADAMPQYFSRPVLDKLNCLLPLALKVPLPFRRFGARVLGLKKLFAKKYWQAHRALS